MRAAIATDGDHVAAHFGRCEMYTLFDIDEEGRVGERQELASPGHEPGVLPRLLADHGVGCIVAGGMGPRAQQMFAQFGILTVVGVSGPVAEVANALAAGTLEGTGDICGGGHQECDGDHH